MGYLVVAFATTWPLVTSLRSHLPMGVEKVVAVPALNAWTVWWNADRVRYGFDRYWQAPIFYPSRNAFAFSEAQPTTLFVAPIVFADGPTTAYNVYLLAVLTLNGIVGYQLLRRVGLEIISAVLGGVFVETLPIVQWQLGVLQLTTLCGVLWVIDRLVALRDGARGTSATGDRERHEIASIEPSVAPSASLPLSQSPPPSIPRTRDSVLLGVAAAACYAACNYFGLFLSVLLPLSFAPLVWGRWRDVRFWLALAGSCLVAAVLASPILWAQLEARRMYAWKREEVLLVSLSAHAGDYLNPVRDPLINIYDPSPERAEWYLGTGPILMLMATGGAIAGLAMRGRRRWTLFLILFGLLAFGLSLGPAASIKLAGGWSPYKSLMALHPFLAIARSPFRFAFFVQLAIALLAAGLLDAMWSLAQRLTKNRSQRFARPIVWTTSVIVITAGVVAALEVPPARQRLYEAPSLGQAWIQWIKDNSDPTRPILCLPFPKGVDVEHYERTALFMYEQIGHRRAMVGGYSGFFPAHFLNLKEQMPQFPDAIVLDELRTRKVEHIVIADTATQRVADRSPSLQLVFADESAKVNVYELLPAVDRRYEGFFGP